MGRVALSPAPRFVDGGVSRHLRSTLWSKATTKGVRAMRKSVGIEEATNHLPRLLEEAESSGEEVVITRRGEEIATVVPAHRRPPGRRERRAGAAEALPREALEVYLR